MTRLLLPVAEIEVLQTAHAECQRYLNMLRRQVDNVEAANHDGRDASGRHGSGLDWVVIDNLRAMRKNIAELHLAAGRLLVVAEDTESKASTRRLQRT